MSRGCTVAVDFASLMMADVLMVVVTIDREEKSIEGWCPIKLRAFEVEEVAMVALLRVFRGRKQQQVAPVFPSFNIV